MGGRPVTAGRRVQMRPASSPGGLALGGGHGLEDLGQRGVSVGAERQVGLGGEGHGDGGGLARGERHRRQRRGAPQPVAAVAAVDGPEGHPGPLQRREVTFDGAGRDLEALGQPRRRPARRTGGG